MIIHAAVLAAALFPGPEAAAQSISSEVKDSYAGAIGAYFDGRPEDAAAALRYAVSLSSEPDAQLRYLKELGALYTETGQPEEALACWTKAEIINSSDAFVPLQKGWTLFSLEDFEQAGKYFESVVPLTASKEINADARYGMALAELGLSGPRRAIPMLQAVYGKNPYLISAAALTLGESFSAMKERQSALTYMKQALVHDPMNFTAELELAELYEKVGHHVAAWQSYSTLADIDTSEPFFESEAKKLVRYLPGNPRDLLYWTKIAWPLQKEPRSAPPGPGLTVALYSNGKGIPSAVTGFKFMCTSNFAIVDEKLGAVTAGKPDTQWSVSYNEQNRIFELRDNMGSLEHSTRQRFTIEPKTPGASVLVKNIQLYSERGVNLGDRELRGSLTLAPTDYGLLMENRVPLENYLPSVVSKNTIKGAPPEALKALAVIMRTKALKNLSSRPHSNAFDMCDSGHCLVYPGIQSESSEATAAVDATRGEVLFSGAAPADISFHEACGGTTEEGVSDGWAFPSGGVTPAGIIEHTMSFPPDSILCAPTETTGWSMITWTAVINARDMERRTDRLYGIGKIKAVIPLKRTRTGRVTSLRLEGTAKTVEVKGFENISYVISAGTLRSPLFFIRPLYEGKYPVRFMLRGIGTGNGSGYCMSGGGGLARSGSKYPAILKHYFPLLNLKKHESRPNK